GNQHLGRPGLDTKAGHRGENFRVGGGPYGGRGGEGGVDLDEHPVALLDKGLHSSQGLNPLREHQRPVRAPDDGHFPWPRGFAMEGVIPQTGQHLLYPGRGRTFRVIKGQSGTSGSQGHHRGVPQALQKIPTVHFDGEQAFFIRGWLHGLSLRAGRNWAARSSAASAEVASCTPAIIRPWTRTTSKELSRASNEMSPAAAGVWTFR